MNIPCMLGVLCFYGLQSIKYMSKVGLLISLNGIVYYSNPKSKILRTNDIFWNAIFGMIIIMVNECSRKYIFIGALSWLFNTFIFNGNNLMHIFGVQLPISIALYNYLNY